jgi:GWxTD domain-containing protein
MAAVATRRSLSERVGSPPENRSKAVLFFDARDPKVMRALGFLGILCVATTSSAIPQPSQREENLPEVHRKWLEEEVPYIISEVERETFLSLTTEGERQAFLEVFWRKRDPNPSTPENEYKTEHYARLAYANEFFGRETFRKGWQTDRGRYYILLGKPNTRRPLEASDAIYPSELWFYNDPELKYLGLPPFFRLLFFRRGGIGEFELYSPLSDGPKSLLTGFQMQLNDFRDDVERSYEKLYEVDMELAEASLSFRTDEGDRAQFQNPAFGTLSLMDDIRNVPFYKLDTSYAERLDFERGNVEADYLFTYVPSFGLAHVLPGPGGAYYLHWVVELDAENVGFVRDEDKGSYSSVFIASLEVVPRDDDNQLVVDQRNESFVTLTEGQAKTSLKLPSAHSGMTPLIPGAYKARIVLRNRACPSREEKDCFKSYTLFESNVDVPEEQEERPELSELVLGYGSEILEEPLYRPFRFGNVEIFPNPRGVYAIGDDLVLAVGPRNAPPGSRLRFAVEGVEPAGKTWVEKTVDVDGWTMAAMVQTLSLAGFDGGRFEVVATLLDAAGSELAREAAPVTVSPRTSITRPAVRGSIGPPRPEVPGVVAMLLGEQYARVSNKAKARSELERALRENPRLGPAREQLAGLLLESNETDGVLTLLEPLVQNGPDRFEVLAILGEAHFRRKEYAKSSELLEKAFALKRPEPRLLTILATAQHEVGNDARAREILERSLALDPEQPEAKDLLEKLKVVSNGGLPRS